MTRRALIIGILCGVLIAGFGYLNDSVLKLNAIVGNHFPVSVFGLLVLVAFGVNPLLRRLGSRLAFGPDELAVIVALALVGCAIPNAGLMSNFSTVLAHPPQLNRRESGWQDSKVYDFAPEPMLLEGGESNQKAITDLIRGTSDQDDFLNFSAVPWSAWRRPAGTWIALILLIAVAVISLALVVHPQWSKREMLRYPIVTVTRAIASGTCEGSDKPLARTYGFWIGFILVFGIGLNNGLAMYLKDLMTPIPLAFRFFSFTQFFPRIMWVWGGWAIFFVTVVPTVVAFAYILPSDIGLSLGVCQLFSVTIIYTLMSVGVDMNYGVTNFGGGMCSWQMFGSYLATGFMMLFIGRHYYVRIALLGFGIDRGGDRPERYTIWAFRTLVLSAVGAVALLVWVGLDLPFAILLVFLMLLAFMVVARVNAESGVFHIEANWMVAWVLLGFFGAEALGPSAFIIAALVSVMTMATYKETLMPFVVNALKMTDDSGVSPGRAGSWFTVVFVLGLAVAVPVVLAADYTHGKLVGGTGVNANPAAYPFENAATQIYEMKAKGVFDASVGYSSIQRLLRPSPDVRLLIAVGVGVALVVVFSTLRLRYPWWPFHPVMFLVWSTFPLMIFSYSFLMGWAIKKTVSRLGGRPLYQKGLPFMIGVIAGDLSGKLLFMLVGGVYYAFTGVPPTP